MAKLTSEQRNNLPEDVFGIPEDRAYPMPDEAHVRSAITYFHACPQGKKKELADNINRMAKKYNMKVSLKPHSPFKPYADKEILEEGATLVIEGFSLPVEVSKILIQERFHVDPNHTVRTFNEYHDEEKFQHINPHTRMPNQLLDDRIQSAINIAIRNAAKNYLDKEYLLNGGKPRTKIQDFVYDSDLNMCYDITRNFVYGGSVDDPYIQDAIRECSCIYDKDMVKNAFGEVRKHTKSPVVNKFIDDLISSIDKTPKMSLLDNVDTKLRLAIDAKGSITALNTNFDGEIIMARQPNFRNFTEKEIYDIENNIKAIDELGLRTLNKLCNEFGFPVWKDGIRLHGVILGMEGQKIIDGYYIAGDREETSNSMFHYFVKMSGVIYMPVHLYNIGNECKVTMIKLFDNDVHPQYFATILDDFYRHKCLKLPKMPIRTITMKGNYPGTRDGVDLEKSPALEGIHISKDGNIRFYFNISTSYMDKYSAIHTALKEDASSHNIPAMKHDLAYLFALIASIEAQFMHKDVDEGTPEYKDAIKARAFAKNDFKKYMKIVQKADPKFNFIKFYTENNYDKEVYTLYTEDIVGIKTLLRKLIF